MRWHNGMINWVRYNKGNYRSINELVIAFNSHFNTNATISALQNQCFKNKISLYYKQDVWTDDKLDWLIESAKIYDDREVILNEFNKRFKTNIKLRALGLVCNSKKINLPKAIKRIEKNNENLKLGHIKLRGFSKKEIGDVIFEGQKNQTFIKIKDTGNKAEDYILKNRYLYEQYHNIKLNPVDDIILFLNGDNNDFSKENLYRVSRKILSAMSGYKMHSYKNVDKLTIIKALEWKEKLIQLKEVVI